MHVITAQESHQQRYLTRILRVHIDCFLITPCSIDNENNKCEYYRGKDYMKKNRKDLKERLRK